MTTRRYYLARIELLVEADTYPEACDAVAEGLRENLRAFAGARSSWIDWRFDNESVPVPHDGKGFEYVEER